MFKNNKILKGSILLAVGAFLSKLIGAFYRVPLTNLLGGEGLGLYQMIFPIYCVLLDFSGAGVPNAISKLISQKNDESYSVNLLKGSLRLLAIIGLVGSGLMLILSTPISTAQGNRDASLGYIFLAPAVALVSIISCYRGYFQGKMQMTPTAISQVIEQVIKLTFGLILVRLFSYNKIYAVAGATFAVTISELVALVYLIVTYKIHIKKHQITYVFNKSLFTEQRKPLIKYTGIITLIGISIPLSQVLDSFLIINFLKGYRADATTLYGLYSGAATTVINLPVAICYGISTVAIPAVSSAKTAVDKNKNVTRALFLTLSLALPCAIFCYFFSPLIVKILFNRLSGEERGITINLIKYLSINVLLLSFLQTENAVLIGKDKPLYPLLSMGVGIAVKIILNILLLPIPKLNIYGGVVSVIACYFTACLVNLILILSRKSVKVKDANQNFDRG